LVAALELLTSPSPSTVSTESFRAESLSRDERDRLTRQVKRAHAWELGNNLVGYGIAARETRVGATDDLALVVYVRKKYPVELLHVSETVPDTLELEGVPEIVPTDVVEIGELKLQALTSKVRPITGGYSIGHIRGTGTFGCLVSDRTDGRLLVLSNSHVLAASGTAKVGDPIFHPGPDERDTTMEVVAKVFSWQPFNFGEAEVNRIDAALAEPLSQESFACEIFDIGVPKGVATPSRGMMVQKSGRTTGHTFGRVRDVNFTALLNYPRPDGAGEAAVRFRDQVLCSRYSDSGDSGALVLDSDGRAVGLHFCGSVTQSVFHPISFVLDELNIDLVTQETTPLHPVSPPVGGPDDGCQ
jgi:hypothetical protein